MPTNPRFTQKFADSIVNTLHCHDRVIFKGHLPFGSDDHLNRWVDGSLKIRRKDFLPFVEQQSDTLIEHAQNLAQAESAPYLYLQGKHTKEKIIQDHIRQRKLSEGLVAVLCCLETCRTVKLRHGQQRPFLVFARRPQRVLYFYFLDPDFGLVYVRLQTWFPFTIQVYVNGHDWLARQMLHKKLGFVQHDNAFTQLDQPAQAQRLAHRFSQLPWIKTLDRWAQRFNPLLAQPWLGHARYYWVTEQAEYSSDVLFTSRAQLAALYPRLLDHAVLNFSAQDILTFLGRRLHHRFDGEVLTDCKKDRLPGTRIKHRVKNNWLKMYDKFGLILRVETVINQPREFRVRRWCKRKERRRLLWCPMNKSVVHLGKYQAHALDTNQRYLDALAIVDLPAATLQNLHKVCEPAPFHGRQRRGLNLLRTDEQNLFRAVLRGEHHLHGFRNRDLASLLGSPSKDPIEKRRRIARISRRLQLLRAHGLIAKIPHTHRYRVTAKGAALMNSAIYIRYKSFPKELENVA